MPPLSDQFAAYLQHKMPEASNIKVLSVGQIFGGASRETYRIKAQWQQHNQTIERGLILRREAEAGLIDTESKTEFEAFRAFFNTPIPVPEPIYLEQDTKWLDRPFIVTSEITDSAAGQPLSHEPYGEYRVKTGTQFFNYLGQIATVNPAELGLVGTLKDVAPKDCWQVELTHWEQVINTLLSPEPIAQAAIRWLRANPPPPPNNICVVHGDYRSGNFMANADGDITAILDWEMAHLGDPLEDLAWAIDPIWAFKQPNRVGGLIEREQALSLFEQSSGLTINPKALRWWEMFSCVKGLGIWGSAAKEFQTGANTDPIMLVAGVAPFSVHEKIAIDKLLAFKTGEQNAR